MSKVLVIPFFIPHAGCPFTCVFCNQWGISGEVALAEPAGMEHKVREYLTTVTYVPDVIETAFFGGSFTGLPAEIQLRWLTAAHDLIKKGLITGIRLSTRPDYISAENLLLLHTYGVTTIELGVQSLVDEVLNKSRRGYTYDDVVKAVAEVRKYPFDLVFQLMLGLPGDNRDAAFLTAQRTITLKPDFIRIYPTVVIKNTSLEKWYHEGSYKPWTLQQAVETATEWLGIFTLYDIPVIRMGLQATDNLTAGQELIAGPYHPAFGEFVESALMLKQIEVMLEVLTIQPLQAGVDKVELTIANRAARINRDIVIYFNPLDYSKVVGQKRANIQHLQRTFSFDDIGLKTDDSLNRGDLRIKTDSIDLSLTRQEYLERYRI